MAVVITLYPPRSLCRIVASTLPTDRHRQAPQSQPRPQSTIITSSTQSASSDSRVGQVVLVLSSRLISPWTSTEGCPLEPQTKPWTTTRTPTAPPIQTILITTTSRPRQPRHPQGLSLRLVAPQLTSMVSSSDSRNSRIVATTLTASWQPTSGLNPACSSPSSLKWAKKVCWTIDRGAFLRIWFSSTIHV